MFAKNFILKQISELIKRNSSNIDIINELYPNNYEDAVERFKKGSKIKIKEKNKGKFTASAKRAGMGVLEFANHVMTNKDLYSSTLVKRANFARNSKKFNHNG